VTTLNNPNDEKQILRWLYERLHDLF